MEADRDNRLPLFRFGILSSACATTGRPGVIHGVTSRTPRLVAFGDVSYVTGSDSAAVAANRAAWSSEIGVDPARWVCAQQVHGSTVAAVVAGDAGRGAGSIATAIPGTDALVTSVPGLPLAVFCADCVPILMYDPVRRAIAAIHAGWRGTVSGVASAAVEALAENFGTEPADLLVGIGPSIGPCCYGVGSEVIESWRQVAVERIAADAVERAIRTGANCSGSESKPAFDLWEANRLLLMAAGVPGEQIEIAGICTRCDSDRFFSHRALSARREAEGRFAAIIALAE